MSAIAGVDCRIIYVVTWQRSAALRREGELEHGMSDAFTSPRAANAEARRRSRIAPTNEYRVEPLQLNGAPTPRKVVRKATKSKTARTTTTTNRRRK